MNLKKLGNNETELCLQGCVILFSYNTPVACFVNIMNNGIPSGWYKTDKKWSNATTKHINKWYKGEYTEKDQQFFYNLISGM